MLKSRIIPCLLIHNGGLVKTINFKEPKYIGDPINAVRIFNELEVDEIMIIDIDASKNNVEPNEELISQLADECRMPLCYGGGIKNINQIERLVSLGVEKVSISSAAINNPELITEAASRVGSQSIVVTMDIKYIGLTNKPKVVIMNGMENTNLNPIEFAKNVESLGAGEIVINSVDYDGTCKGYDHSIINMIYREIKIPLTALGGARSIEDIQKLILNFPLIGAAAGSLFVLKGKYKAVLINYISALERKTYNI